MKTILLAGLIAVSFSGCWLMPYQENFSCNSDISNGRCGMVRDNYNYENEQIKNFQYAFDETNTTTKKEVTVKEDCSKYASDIEAYSKCNQRYEYFILRTYKGEEK